MADAKVSLASLETFRGVCLEYEEGMEAAMAALNAALGNVGESWRDEDFSTIAEKTADLERAISEARAVVAEELRPFVEKKIGQLASK
ncbi:MAG: hypothetical protein IK066_13020 [Kiritimatiellae bacterium]|nr:hypothetical protein [Kiritimatiellia bacterium]